MSTHPSRLFAPSAATSQQYDTAILAKIAANAGAAAYHAKREARMAEAEYERQAEELHGTIVPAMWGIDVWR